MARTYFELIKAHKLSGYTIDMVDPLFKDEVMKLLDAEGLDGYGNAK